MPCKYMEECKRKVSFEYYAEFCFGDITYGDCETTEVYRHIPPVYQKTLPKDIDFQYQKHTIKSSSTWPEHALTEINKARSKLQEINTNKWKNDFHKLRQIIDKPPILYAPPSIYHGLDYFLVDTTTYWGFLKNNNLLSRRIKTSTLPSDSVLILQGEHAIVEITDIMWSIERQCNFCSNSIKLHRQAVKLLNGKLVCVECYDKVFETILRKS